MERTESIIRGLLKLADVDIDGSRPWDLTVHDRRFYPRLLHGGLLALGESYMDRWWDCTDLTEFVVRVQSADLEHRISPGELLMPVIRSKFLNVQSKVRAARDVRSHYNRGNLLFRHMLDKRMAYSCGYWKDADNLDAAQEAKLDLICRKVGLRPGALLLDIGCGWGSLVKYAAERYGVRAVGITLSEEQVSLGRELCKGLPVEIRLQDYRDLSEKYDHIVSVGMFEHVGAKNYRTFMDVVHRNLNDHGLFLLHTIGANTVTPRPDPWMQKYIFPGNQIPAIEQIAEASAGLFVMEDWHNFGADYAKTLRAWYDNFTANWEKLISQHYDDRFYRMWTYMLQTTAGSFRARSIQLWQIVFSKKGIAGGYESTR
jgi:cyclopropane-fatty-acyl-phospholipid synthase